MRSLNKLGNRIVTILNYFVVDTNLVVYFLSKSSQNTNQRIVPMKN